MPEANPNPAENRRAGQVRTPEAAPQLNAVYVEVEDKLRKAKGKELAAFLEAEIAASRATPEDAGAVIETQQRTFNSQLRPLLLRLQEINPQDISAAAELGRQRGLPMNDALYQGIRDAALEMAGEVEEELLGKINAAEDAGDTETAERLRKELRRILEGMPPEGRMKIGVGLRNVGFFVEEWKDKFFAKTFAKASERFEEKNTLGKFFGALHKNFVRDAEAARKKIEEVEIRSGKLAAAKKQLANVGYLTRNIMKVAGFAWNMPIRAVMAGGLIFSRGFEAAKEVRLQNEEVIEKTRVHDIERAAEEAWKIYEDANEKVGRSRDSRGLGLPPLPKDLLEKAYLENIPTDLLRRLSEPGAATGVLQSIIQKDVFLFAATAEKLVKNKTALKIYEKHLKDLDRMVTQTGTVDALALGARYGETAGKTAVAGAMALTGGFAIYKLWEKMPEIFEKISQLEFDLKLFKPAPPERVPRLRIEKIPEPPAKLPIAPEGAPYPFDQPEGLPGPEVEIKGAPAEALVGRRGIWGTTEELLKNRAKTDQALAKILENPAKRTYLIDMIKDKVAADPDQYLSGSVKITDIDRIPGGTKLNIAGILEDAKFKDMVAETSGLSPATLEQIAQNNAKIAKWVAENPGKPLTTPQVEEILHGKPAAGTGSGVFQGEVFAEGYTGSYTSGGEDLSEVPVVETKPDAPQPPTAKIPPEAAPPPVPEGQDQGGGRVIPLEPGEGPKPEAATAPAPAAEALPKVSGFGTVYETKIAEQYGFTPDQFATTKGLTVEKLLKEIPIDKDEQVKMWERFNQGNPPDLWPSGRPYYSSILQKQVKLAKFLWTYFPRPDVNPEMQRMTIEQVINLNRLGPR